MNAVLRNVLREGAKTLREVAGGEDVLDKARTEILAVVHRILCLHLGTPPERFDWQWTDKDRNFHRDGEMTPQEFAESYVTLPLEDYVCLVHDPRVDQPVRPHVHGRVPRQRRRRPPVKYLNVEIDLMKRLAQEQIVAGEPVWFGCDVGSR